MDWSLVLLSQGIETTIEQANEEHGWQLVVMPGDYEHALESLRQYRAENRGDVWRRYLPWSGLIFDWRSALWFGLLALIFVLGEMRWSFLEAAGSMHNDAVWKGEWWRLFTATMLHADLPHLVANITTGVLLLGFAMGGFGSGFALLASYLAGVGGNLAGLLLYSDSHRGLGASGMVLGSLGLLTAQSFVLLRAGASARQLVLRAMMGGLLLLVFWGVDPATDVIAHVGGFVSGFVLGAALSLLPMRWNRNLRLNRCATSVCVVLVMLTWWLALYW